MTKNIHGNELEFFKKLKKVNMLLHFERGKILHI